MSEHQAAQLLLEFLRRTHLSAPSDVAAVVAGQAEEALGATDVTTYVIDLAQAELVPLPVAGDPGAGLSVDGTVAGRAFADTTILRTPAGDGRQRLWLPLLDGTERVGVLALTLPHDPVPEDLVAVCQRYSHLVAMTLVTKASYGDAVDVARRREPMSIAAELSSAMAPPLVFATEDVALAGLLEPCYDNGGDALDYALNDRVLHVAVLDAMGHGLAAAGVAAFALSAYRFSRRAGQDLLETYAAMDFAVGQQFPGERFVTALIGRLDLDSGMFTWVSAGHPPALLLRHGKVVRQLDSLGATPLGVGVDAGPPEVGTEALEPGDLLLLHTDGLTEARGPGGAVLPEERVLEFLEREVAAGRPAPETLRRLRHALLRRERTVLRDDATALLVEWRRGAERALLPATVADDA